MVIICSRKIKKKLDSWLDPKMLDELGLPQSLSGITVYTFPDWIFKWQKALDIDKVFYGSLEDLRGLLEQFKKFNTIQNHIIYLEAKRRGLIGDG